jgi:hypothetical protein
MKLKIELNGEQEDKIIAKSIKLSYERNDRMGRHENPDDFAEMQEAFRLVYHYYTGKHLK